VKQQPDAYGREQFVDNGVISTRRKYSRFLSEYPLKENIDLKNSRK